MKVFSIKDNDINTYNRPFLETNVITATRGIQAGLQGTMIEKFPSSFALYELGTFDENTGKFQNHTQPRIVAPIHQLLEKVSQEQNTTSGVKIEKSNT